MLNVLNEYLFLSARKDTKKSTYFQIISVVSSIYGVILRNHSAIYWNHTVVLRIYEEKKLFFERKNRSLFAGKGKNKIRKGCDGTKLRLLCFRTVTTLPDLSDEALMVIAG